MWPCTVLLNGLMKTSQLSKDMSSDRRSKLGVCNAPTKAPPSPSSALWGLWTGRIKSDWEQFWSYSSTTQMLFLKCFKENLIDTIGSDWASLLIFTPFFLSFLAAWFKVKSCVKEGGKKKKDMALQKADPQNNSTLLFWQNISSQRARRSACRSL